VIHLDVKNESTTLNFKSKIVSNFSSSKLTLSKTTFKNVARDSAVDAKKKIFMPVRVRLFWHKLGLHFEPAR